MILDFDKEMAQAGAARPFANGFEGEAWMSAWCEDCANSTALSGCVLTDVALLGKTPFAWESLVRNSLDKRYVCHEFRDNGRQ